MSKAERKLRYGIDCCPLTILKPSWVEWDVCLFALPLKQQTVVINGANKTIAKERNGIFKTYCDVFYINRFAIMWKVSHSNHSLVFPPLDKSDYNAHHLEKHYPNHRRTLSM